MRILFWNTNGNENINPYIVSLVRDYNTDVLVLAEYKADKVELYAMLKENDLYLSSCNTIGCGRINIWSNYVDVESGLQNKYYSIQIIRKKVVLCCAHLISDLHGDHSEERAEIIRRIMQDIQDTEGKIRSKQTIIIGDFNEMPYGKGCLNANGFHGLPVLNVNDMPTRTVNEIEYRKFYNPMWSLLGDFSYPPGTYYLNKATLSCPMWYMLDQVIVSKDVLPLFRKESLKIITSCSFSDLSDASMHPNKEISDHFPIVCEIQDE